MQSDKPTSSDPNSWDVEKFAELLRFALEEVYLPTKPTISDLCARSGIPSAEIASISDFFTSQGLLKLGAKGLLLSITAEGEKSSKDRAFLKSKIDAYSQKLKQSATEDELRISGRKKFEEIFGLFQWFAERKYFAQFIFSFLGVLLSVLVFAFTAPTLLNHIYGSYFDREFRQRIILPEKLPVDVSQFVTKQELLIEDNKRLHRENEELKAHQETTRERFQEDLRSVRAANADLQRKVSAIIGKSGGTNSLRPATNSSLSISLSWASDNDLDIHVQSPTKDVGWFEHPTNSWGFLSSDIQTAGEEVFQITRLEAGTYNCFIHNFKGQTPVSCHISIFSQRDAASIAPGERVFNKTLEIGESRVIHLTFQVLDCIDPQSVIVTEGTIVNIPWLRR